MLLAQEVKKAVGYCGEYMEEASASAALIARMRFDTCSARRAACPPPDTPWLPGPPGIENDSRLPTFGSLSET